MHAFLEWCPCGCRRMAFCRIGPAAFKRPDPYVHTCGVVIDENNDAEMMGSVKFDEPRKAFAIVMAAARCIYYEGFDVYIQRLTDEGLRKKWIMRK